MSLSTKELIEQKKRREMLERILSRTVTGEVYIDTSPRIWKSITLKNFNKIHRKELTLTKLLDLMEQQGVTFNQKRSLIEYPVKEYLLYIAKETNKDIEI